MNKNTAKTNFIFYPIIATLVMVFTFLGCHIIIREIRFDVYECSVAYYDAEGKYLYSPLISQYGVGFFRSEDGKSIACKKVTSIEGYDVYLIETGSALKEDGYVDLQVKVDELSFYQKLLRW